MNQLNNRIPLNDSKMIINIEANIAAGKSTFMNLCKTELENRGWNVMVVQEQVDDWTSVTDSSGKSIFDCYYQDTPKYAYVFQTYVLMSRIATLSKMRKEYPDTVLLCERSYMTDYEIFAKTLYESGDMNEMEWNVYNKWHNHVSSMFTDDSSGTIYLRASPSTCIARVQTRNRQSEDNIKLDYLVSLHQKHEEWLMGARNSNILVLNANNNIVLDKTLLNEHVDHVEAFLGQRSLDASRFRKVPAVV